ncbi:mannose-6-phosphate isomerase [Oecophyllibacter saccharovorans]|nr:mannose-6-phosphate isomerase [Oecophyllibacter saccharovorans]
MSSSLNDPRMTAERDHGADRSGCSLEVVGQRWLTWLQERALPLWHSRGFDTETGLYHERLSLTGQPIGGLERRLMVQARQIATFSQAALDGLLPEALQTEAAERALGTLERVTRLYHRADGQSGWVFSLNERGEIANPCRDLYGHAFILYAHALAGRLAFRRSEASLAVKLRQRALVTLGEVKEIFAAPHGGLHACWASAPGGRARRSQNPHMHLLEALLALHQTWPEPVFLEEAQELVALACRKMIHPETGYLQEFFQLDWQPLAGAPASMRVEPGHQFEWAWLLGQYGAQAGARLTLAQAASLHQVAEQLFSLAMRKGFAQSGVNAGFISDSLDGQGGLCEASVRLWPQTECLRLLAQHAGRKGGLSILACLADNVMHRFLPASLQGGWIDRFDAAGRALSADMPASSLYHVYGAARAMVLKSAAGREKRV